jgi:hypothetical protein
LNIRREDDYEDFWVSYCSPRELSGVSRRLDSNSFKEILAPDLWTAQVQIADDSKYVLGTVYFTTTKATAMASQGTINQRVDFSLRKCLNVTFSMSNGDALFLQISLENGLLGWSSAYFLMNISKPTRTVMPQANKTMCSNMKVYAEMTIQDPEVSITPSAKNTAKFCSMRGKNIR